MRFTVYAVITVRFQALFMQRFALGETLNFPKHFGLLLMMEVVDSFAWIQMTKSIFLIGKPVLIWESHSRTLLWNGSDDVIHTLLRHAATMNPTPKFLEMQKV